ncbi:MAG TPA: methylmalonyl-CoA mutase family protein, partial [Cyclobacteriaceae bacterium]|nr:methylmalonyl-CoA mutase family protein [Cyclobacteriaceae bacterium]
MSQAVAPDKTEKKNLAGHEAPQPYLPKNKVRVVTAASLFDGHDAAINIMRRIIQATGCEVIHLGHDRSVEEVVNTAIQEDAQAIAMTSYQGGHNEYFKYMYDLLVEKGAGHIKIFAGGGGVILPEEIRELMDYGITRIYSPDDGRAMGLQGMINDLVQSSDFALGDTLGNEVDEIKSKNPLAIARLISAAENYYDKHADVFKKIHALTEKSKIPVLGITGTGGAGKSSMVDEIVRRFLFDFKDKTVGLISVDPSKRKTGGALLGDRIRMNAINNPRVYMRSLATRQSNLALSQYVKEAIGILKAAGFDLIILETSGIGQSDTEIIDHSDVSLYVMTPEYGAATQLEKIDMLDFADVIALNKFDKRGALDALRDVKKQYQRNHKLFDQSVDQMPVCGTIASQFNDPGTNRLYKQVIDKISEKTKVNFSSGIKISDDASEKVYVIPPGRTRYLSEISENNRAYDAWVDEQSNIAQKLYGMTETIEHLKSSPSVQDLKAELEKLKLELDPKNWKLLTEWQEKVSRYKGPLFKFKVRDKEIGIKTHSESLSHLQIPKIALPKYKAWGDLLQWSLQENVPGEFPYTSGIYPFKREGEDPTRMFAGEGGPERTNRRFHYVSISTPAKRLSTAFDSVTLYGNDPDYRPDIYGKIGNSGVSICCLDDAKKLYSGFNLTDPRTSVSMTINGPAPMLLGYFMNAAIDQQCEIYIRKNGLEKEVKEKIEKIYKDKNIERPAYQGALPKGNDGLGLMLLGTTGDQVLPADVYAKIKEETLAQVRGTVQADILKEDQAQNTCIFSTEFALRLMGDVQQYFIDHKVRNFYSVSISGYH